MTSDLPLEVQELTTPLNSGRYKLLSGMMFDVTARHGGPAILVENFKLHLSSSDPVYVEIRSKPGTYEGYERKAEAWTLIGSATGVQGGGPRRLVSLPGGFLSKVAIRPGYTRSFYIAILVGRGQVDQVGLLAQKTRKRRWGEPLGTFFEDDHIQMTFGCGIKKMFSNKYDGSYGWTGAIVYATVDNDGTAARGAGSQNIDPAAPAAEAKHAGKIHFGIPHLGFLEKAEMAIPAEVRMISGCEDSQTSADVYDITTFKLPHPMGRSGGALTSALLQVLYHDQKHNKSVPSFQDLLLKVRDNLHEGKYSQFPQLTSSRPLDVKQPFEIVPRGSKGVRRALLIGINYVGQEGALSGCWTDVLNVAEYLINVQGFKERNMTILLDDGKHKNPTRRNIIKAYQKLVKKSQPGDCCYCHYSGHGGQLPDDNGDEDDGLDETMIPVDFSTAGQIRDDELFAKFVVPLRKGVRVTCVMDCCHSGTILDLPYQFKANGEEEHMTPVMGFDFHPLLEIAGVVKESLTTVTRSLESMFVDGEQNKGGKHKFKDFTRCLVGGVQEGRKT